MSLTPIVFLHIIWIFIVILLGALAFVVFIRYLVQVMANSLGGYGRLFRSFDCLFDEDFSDPNPQFNIVSMLELDGDLTIEATRNSFNERVLQAKVRSSRSKELRYPEFQQYITTLFGYLIWKNEENFGISEHIIEMETKKGSPLDIEDLHQTHLNYRHKREKSPWQLTLIRNAITVDDCSISSNVPGEKCQSKSILVFTMHHMMGDAKSIIQIFVECFGGKSMNTPAAHYHKMSFSRQLLLPLDCIREGVKLLTLHWKHPSHPWMARPNDDSKNVLRYSKKLSISEMKSVAEKFDVTVSAILLTLIAGAMRRFNPKLTDKGVMVGFTLPLEGHPNVLANHARAAGDLFPTHKESQSTSTADRLRFYETFYKNVRMRKRSFPGEKGAWLCGLLPRSRYRRKIHYNHYFSIGITNIAGEREGFSIGGAWCSAHTMCVSAPRGVAGAVFTIFSYQNNLRIFLTGKESVLPETDAEKVVSLINLEYSDLVGQA